MPYQNLNLSALTTLVQNRVQNLAFWSQQEITDSISEAIKLWQVGTGFWKSRIEVTTVAKRCIYDLTAINDQSGKPLVQTVLMPIRCCFNGASMHPTGWTDIDSTGRSWQTDLTGSAAVPDTPILWGPMGLNLMFIWPADATGNNSLQLDVLQRAPVLVNSIDFLNLDSTEVPAFLSGVVHFLTFKRSGIAFKSTTKGFKEFLKAMALRNSHLQLVSSYRSYMGEDTSRNLRGRRLKEVSGRQLTTGVRG